MKSQNFIRCSRTKSFGILAVIALMTTGISGSFTQVQAQEVDWKVNFDYVLDNTEYDRSTIANSRTINAIIPQPMVGLKWADRHSLYGGVRLTKLLGTPKVIDKAELTLFYDYQSEMSHFRAGAFPREDVLPQYWTQFYSSSYRNFKHPQMLGAFYQYGKSGESFINFWLDWTGHATPETRESCTYGMSGQLKKGIFFVDLESYMNYLGNTYNSTDFGVQEHLMLQSTAGVMWKKRNSFSGRIGVGVLTGMERDRRENGEKYNPTGFVARADAEYWGIGTRNLTYIGQPRLRMYDQYESLLYPGATFLRSNFYHRNDLYINLIQSNNVKVAFTSSQHFSESMVHFQQTFTVKIRLDKSTANSARTHKFEYPWKKIFE